MDDIVDQCTITKKMDTIRRAMSRTLRKSDHQPVTE